MAQRCSNMKLPEPHFVAVILLSAVLTGCVALRPQDLPADARKVVLVAVSSGFVRVRQPFLRSHDGQFQIYGTVAAEYGSPSTDHTHLEISFFDAAGHLLRSAIAHFSPSNLVSRFPNRNGSYSLTVESLPAGTARIEVSAHQGGLSPAA